MEINTGTKRETPKAVMWWAHGLVHVVRETQDVAKHLYLEFNSMADTWANKRAEGRREVLSNQEKVLLEGSKIDQGIGMGVQERDEGSGSGLVICAIGKEAWFTGECSAMQTTGWECED